MYANFEEPTGRSRDRDLGTLNLRRNCHFCLENLLICFSYKFAERGMLKFEHKLGVNRDCRLCSPSLEAPSHVIAVSEAKN